MTIEIFTGDDLERARAAGRAAARILTRALAIVRPGVRTTEIDRLVRRETRREGGHPSPLGHEGFPAAVCTSVNQVVCHGVPSDDVRLQAGDIVNVDVTTELDGFHGDTSVTVAVGSVDRRTQHLIETARRCLQAGIDQVQPGHRIGDIGAAIQEIAHAEGYSVVRDFTGHGIGRTMHAPPEIPHVGRRGTGLRLRSGMIFTIEPMINAGRPEVRVLPDGWTVETRDGSLSAQFEHTVLVIDEGCEVLTSGESRLQKQARSK